MKRIGKNETTEINTVKKCFVALEAALYLLFLALDAFSTGGDGVKYLTIVVCLLAAVWSARHGGSCLMAWAMAFTLAADTFLLLLDRWYGAGIALFCVVQGLYLARIRRACGHTLWVLRAGLVAAAWPLLSALGMGTALNLLAALDFDGAFTVFHSIFFPGKDNWLFDPVTDPVILILPEAFFRNCAIAIVTVLLTVCIMLVVTGRKRPSRRSAPGEGTAS